MSGINYPSTLSFRRNPYLEIYFKILLAFQNSTIIETVLDLIRIT